MRTFTDGSSWKMNGRAEAEVGFIKRLTKTLLKGSGVEENLWPLAARHAGERRWRSQLEAMNYPVKQLRAFGSKAMAKTKAWNHRSKDWEAAREAVTILGPDVTMSASSGGYFVQGEDGKFFHTTDVIETEDQPEEEGPPGGGAGAEGGGPGGGGPRRRIAYKRPPELEDREWEADLRALAMECQARGRHMMEEEWRLGEEQGADHDLVKKTVGMLAEEDARVGAWLAAMQKAEDLDLEETCAKKATEEEVFLQTKTYALADVKKEIEAWRPSMVEERAALLKSGVVRAIKPREAEELKREALEKGIPYDRVPGKAVFTRKAATGRRKCRGVACKLHVGAAGHGYLCGRH